MSSTTNSQVLPAPPSLMKSLMAGFDAVSNHIGLILFPVFLDLFLWLGPHLSMVSAVQRLFEEAARLPEMRSPELTEMMKTGSEVWLAIVERVNLFSALRSFPVGVSSLMSGTSPVNMPGGKPLLWEVQSLGIALGLWLLVSTAGLIIGSLYFACVAQAAILGKVEWKNILTHWPWTSTQVFLLTLLWVALLVLISIPFSCLIWFLLLSGLALGRLVVFIYGGLLAWLLLPLVFSPHGIFLNGQNVWASLKEGVRLTRLTMPSTGLFFLLILILSEGLDVLWRIPLETSWWTVIGLAGHAFVTTGLLAATFVYYQEVERWSQRMLQQVKFSSLMKL